MVELVRNNGVLFAKQRLKQPTVRVKAARVKYRVLGAQKFADLSLKLFVYRLRPADKSDRREPIAPIVQRFPSRFNYRRMVAQSQIIIGAHIKNLAPTHINMRILRTLDDPLVLIEPRLADVIDRAL